MSSGKVLFGMIAGGVAVAALGLLFATKKGSSVRKSISNKSEDFWVSFTCRFDDLIAVATKEIKDAKNQVGGLYSKGKKKLQYTQEDLKTDVNRN